MSEEVTGRVCSKCKVWKEFSKFAKNKTRKYGYEYICKLCTREIRQANREEISAKRAIYYIENRERLIEEARNYREENEDIIRQKRKEKYAENRESILQERKEHYWENHETIRKHRAEYYSREKDKINGYKDKEKTRRYAKEYCRLNRDRRNQKNKEWREKNAEELKIKTAEFRRNNPQNIAIHQHNRRALKANAQGDHTVRQLEQQWEIQEGCCFWCDHPLLDPFRKGEGWGRKAHLDHVIPLKRGGSNSIENLTWACEQCNCSKGAKLPSEWKGSNGRWTED